MRGESALHSIILARATEVAPAMAIAVRGELDLPPFPGIPHGYLDCAGTPQNPSPGPSSTAVPSVPSETSNMLGNRSAQPRLAAGQYCRALPSTAATVGTRAARLAECRKDDPGTDKACTQRNIPYFCAAAPINNA